MSDNISQVSKSRDRLDVSLGEFLRRLLSRMDATAMDRLVEGDISLTQVRLLLTLSSCGTAMPIGELAQKLALSVATAGRNVDQLVRLDLLERKECVEDRRVKLVSLSQSGIAMTNEHVDSQRQALRDFVGALPVENCEMLIDALQPILAGNYLDAKTKGTRTYGSS